MKNLFTLITLFALCCPAGVRSQALEWIYKGEPVRAGQEITITEYDPVMGQLYLELGIRNNGKSDLEVVVGKEDKQLVAGAEVQLCVGVNCYPATALRSEPFIVAAGQTDESFHVNCVLPDEHTYGVSTSVFTLSSGDETASVTVHFDYSVPTSNAQIATAPLYQVRQSGRTLCIRNDSGNTVQAQVSNIHGRSQFSQLLGAGAEAWTPGLERGVYIVAFYQAGRLVEAKKLIIH